MEILADETRRRMLSCCCLAGDLAARGIAVQMIRIAWRHSAKWERELAIMMIPRGLVTAVLALEIEGRRGTEFQFLIPLAFALILFSNLLMLIGTIRHRAVREPALAIPLPADGAIQATPALALGPAARDAASENSGPHGR